MSRVEGHCELGEAIPIFLGVFFGKERLAITLPCSQRLVGNEQRNSVSISFAKWNFAQRTFPNRVWEGEMMKSYDGEVCYLASLWNIR